ncbi:MAG: hypothetical protein EXX96DRAFT_574133 [Benjaminiella poitrasii]|nr:MAG: hypothetical protein EXX96DRAFT_574133 [Benjaminiella poitrasii]
MDDKPSHLHKEEEELDDDYQSMPSDDDTFSSSDSDFIQDIDCPKPPQQPQPTLLHRLAIPLIQTALHHLEPLLKDDGVLGRVQAQTRAVVDPRIDAMADQLEHLMNQYLPHDDHQEKEIVASHTTTSADRLLHAVHSFATRVARRMADVKDQQRIKDGLVTWLLSQQDRWPTLKGRLEWLLQQQHWVWTEKYWLVWVEPETSRLNRVRALWKLGQQDLFNRKQVQ